MSKFLFFWGNAAEMLASIAICVEIIISPFFLFLPNDFLLGNHSRARLCEARSNLLTMGYATINKELILRLKILSKVPKKNRDLRQDTKWGRGYPNNVDKMS